MTKVFHPRIVGWQAEASPLQLKMCILDQIVLQENSSLFIEMKVS